MAKYFITSIWPAGQEKVCADEYKLSGTKLNKSKHDSLETAEDNPARVVITPSFEAKFCRRTPGGGPGGFHELGEAATGNAMANAGLRSMRPQQNCPIPCRVRSE